MGDQSADAAATQPATGAPTQAQNDWVYEVCGVNPRDYHDPARPSGNPAISPGQEDLVAAPPWDSRSKPKTIPNGRYKDVPDNPWAGLPEVLYPDTPDNFSALMAISYEIGEMALIQFDTNTVMNEGQGRRLPHKVKFASSFATGHASSSKLPDIKDLEAEYNRLEGEVKSNIASITKPELKAFLSQNIYLVMPPLAATAKLRRTDDPPSSPFSPWKEEQLIRFLLKRGS